MERMDVREILKAGLLDNARTEKNGDGILVIPDWQSFFNKGKREKLLMCRFFFVDLGAAPLLYDYDKVIDSSPYFLVSHGELHYGRIRNTDNRILSMIFLCDEQDDEWESTLKYFQNILQYP